MKPLVWGLLVLGMVGSAFGQDCSHYWVASMDTDPRKSKGFSGDTNNGYGLLSVWGDDRTELVLRGRFPSARFISIQTYDTRFQSNVDALLDREIEPDAGSVNPYREGADQGAVQRNFTVRVVPEAYFTGGPNEVKFPRGRKVHSFFYRIYSPNQGVVLSRADLPTVEARDAATGRPVRCPRQGPGGEYLPIPQFVVNVASAFMGFEFKEKSGVIGSNAGVPSYLYALKKMEAGEMVAVRLRAPTFTNTRSGVGPFPADEEVRYWSVCLQNFVRNETLSCLPDFQATPDGDGWVTLVIGSRALEISARARGYNFLEDTRRPGQKVLGIVYRNVLPSEAFQPHLYQGDYRPIAWSCPESDFRAGGCDRP